MNHTPVLLHEVLQFLNPKLGDFIIDGTMNGGGHTAAILEAVGPTGRVLGIDLDEAMVAKARARFADQKNMFCICGNYADLPDILQEKKMGLADGLLLDLGFSSEQLRDSGRGFSFNPKSHGDEPLLMTYDPRAKPARQVLREFNEKELAKMIFELSGEKFAMRIARRIKERGRKNPIETAAELAAIIRESVPETYERGRIDPATRTFQALRIYVNRELENLEIVLGNLPRILARGGRAVVISFHSLEDRVAKRTFQKMAKESQLEIITKKPVTASLEEIRRNPRSRSAKLRAIKMSF